MLINDVKQFFDEHAPRWDEICFHDPEKLRTMIALAQIPKNARIADLACGTGVMLPYLLEKEPKTIAAVDLSEKMIAVAKDVYKRQALQRAPVRAYYRQTLPHAFCKCPSQGLKSALYNHPDRSFPNPLRCV